MKSEIVNRVVRKASISDIPVITDLANKIWYAHYTSIISNEQIAYMLDLMYSENAIKKQIAEGQQFYLFIENDVPLAYAAVSENENNDMFLHKFYVDTDKHRSGIGVYFFNKLFNEIYTNYNCIRLTVNRQNFKAINFYFKNGFIIEKVEDFKIGNGYFMNDFVMIKKN